MNELQPLHDFFSASVGSAAALIGLLFVAISIAPEKTFGEAADQRRRIDAERAFTALGNVFFVSLVAVQPFSPLTAIAVLALLAIGQIVRVGAQMLRTGTPLHKWRELGLISLCAYAFEFEQAVRLALGGPSREGLVWITLGLYGYALSTAWSLLGARDHSRR